ncbi:MFS transporter [Novosphingobium flavum]|uniref:MFS transporter n=1 Tax=Novosphingobium flavum TaxID=1778672 RepID=A0A7X1FRA4_9SPHN|nr:MFS transporter [Novosphingobium flavum]MBC2665508.1 MFS transporter [Novosphingobium flavum]
MATIVSPSPEMARAALVRRWVILTLLMLGALIGFVDRVSISSALAVASFKAHFGLSDIARGWINSAFFWSYAVMQVPMGWVVDRYGVKWPYAICFFVWCVASALIGLVSTLWALILMRLIIGVAEAIVVPATYRWVRNNFDPDRSGAALGFYALGTKFGPALGAPAAAWLIVMFDWRVMFLITGLVGVIWLVPWMLVARERTGALPIEAGVSSEAEAEVVQRLAAKNISLSSLLANPFILATLVVYFCYNYFLFFCITWMPAYLIEQRGLSLEQMGFYTFFSFTGIAVVAFASGWLADVIIGRVGRAVFVRKAFVLAGFAAASTVVLGAWSQSVEAALFWNVLSLSGLGLATANNLALCSIMFIPGPIVGRVKGIQNTAVAIAGIVAPLMTGWLLHLTGSFVAPMTLIFVFLLLGAATVVVAIRKEWAPIIP